MKIEGIKWWERHDKSMTLRCKVIVPHILDTYNRKKYPVQRGVVILERLMLGITKLTNGRYEIFYKVVRRTPKECEG